MDTIQAMAAEAILLAVYLEEFAPTSAVCIFGTDSYPFHPPLRLPLPSRTSNAEVEVRTAYLFHPEVYPAAIRA